MIEIYAVNLLEEIKKEDWDILYERVSNTRKQKVDKYKFDIDKKRSVFAEHLIMYSLNKQYDINKKEINYSYNKYGKPMIMGREDIFFNLSHSGDWVVCAVGDCLVGIDVESIGKIEDGLCKKVLTENEYRFLRENPEKKEEYFYKFWTLKESFVKALGVGLSLSFQEIEMILNEEKIKVACERKKDCEFSFACEPIDERHVLSVCAKSKEEIAPFSSIHLLTIEKLLSI